MNGHERGSRTEAGAGGGGGQRKKEERRTTCVIKAENCGTRKLLSAWKKRGAALQ